MMMTHAWAKHYQRTSYFLGFKRGWVAGFSTAAVVSIGTVFIYNLWIVWGPK